MKKITFISFFQWSLRTLVDTLASVYLFSTKFLKDEKRLCFFTPIIISTFFKNKNEKNWWIETNILVGHKNSAGTLIPDVKNTMAIILLKASLYNDKNREVKIRQDLLSNRL